MKRPQCRQARRRQTEVEVVQTTKFLGVLITLHRRVFCQRSFQPPSVNFPCFEHLCVAGLVWHRTCERLRCIRLSSDGQQRPRWDAKAPVDSWLVTLEQRD